MRTDDLLADLGRQLAAAAPRAPQARRRARTRVVVRLAAGAAAVAAVLLAAVLVLGPSGAGDRGGVPAGRPAPAPSPPDGGWSASAPVDGAGCGGRHATTPVAGPVPAVLRDAFGVLRRARTASERRMDAGLGLIGPNVVRRYAGGVRVQAGFVLVAADVTRRESAFHRCKPADGPGVPALCLYGDVCATPAELRRGPVYTMSGTKVVSAFGLAPDGVKTVVFRIGRRDHVATVAGNVFSTSFPGTPVKRALAARARYGDS